MRRSHSSWVSPYVRSVRRRSWMVPSKMPASKRRHRVERLKIMDCRLILVVPLTALLAVGCGGGHQPAPPSAASLAHRLGCQVLGSGEYIASQYSDQDVSVGGPASCQADEIYTFRSRTDETKWLSAYSAYGSSISSCLYMVTGTLWALDLGGGADGTISYAQIQREIGGKQWQGGC
jgi:hypothetical protein